MVRMSTTRDRILDALETLLLADGPQHVTLEKVAAAARVSKGGLLYHFKSKDALLTAMVRRLGERSDDMMAQATAGGVSLAEWYLQYPDAADEREVALFRSTIAAMRSGDEPHSEVRQALIDVMRSWDAALHQEIGDPVLAEIVRLAGDGVYLGALLGMPPADPALHRKVIARLLPASSADG